VVALAEGHGDNLVVRASSAPGNASGSFDLNHSAIQQVWREREARLLKVPAEFGPPELNLSTADGPRALFIVPIATQKRVWGLLLVFLLRPPLFESDDLALLTLFCDQTAIALGYVESLVAQQVLVEQLRRYNQRLETLNEIDRAILAAQSPQKIASEALIRLRQLVPSQRASVVLFDYGKSQAQVVAVDAQGVLSPPEEALIPLNEFLPIDLLLDHRPVFLIEDTTSFEPRTAVINLLNKQGVRSLLLAALSSENQLIGELSLASNEISAFGTEDQDIAREVADQLAITIRQARLRAELQHYAEELEVRVAERTAQLETANQELEAFAYSVSHDLRAPLRAMDGFSRILLANYASELPTEAQRYFQLVRNNTQQMGQLIDDLLSFSRLSRQPLKKQTIDPAGLVRLVLSELLKEHGERQVDISVGDLPTCEADPSLFKQVLTNLLSNALKFTSKRPAACIEVNSQSINGEQVYFVKDNGVGFDMRYAGKLFGVFQRLHLAEEFEGTGVGLAIVQRIIHRHGGRIWAEAAVDQGAAFYFTVKPSSQDKIT
jgi:signal transduction histidine kinase